MSDSTQNLGASEQERRRHMRYRLCESIRIHSKSGRHTGVTREISISGLSASTSHTMRIDEEVRLVPVVGEQLEAIVRHKTEDVYGFEFLDVPPKVEGAIHVLCKGLFPFRGTGDI
jgi:hypothetical protein